MSTPRRERTSWTRESLIQAARDWAEKYGQPPGVADWNPSLAKRRGQTERVERFAAGTWPHVTTVRSHWKAWGAFLRDAGFTSGPPRRRPPVEAAP